MHTGHTLVTQNNRSKRRVYVPLVTQYRAVCVIGLSTLFATDLSFANSRSQTTDNVSNYTLAIGLYTKASQSEYIGAKDALDLMPAVEWSWENWFVHNYRLGSYLGEGRSWGATASLGVASFGDSERGNGDELSDFKTLGDVYTAAASMAWAGDWGGLEYSIEQDISDRHSSYFFRTRYGLDINMGNWTLEPVISLYYLPEKLVNAYYGVPTKQAQQGRSAYTAKDAYVVDTSVNLSYTFRSAHTWHAGLTLRHFSNEIYNSPIVNERRSVSLSAGYFYAF